MRIVLADDFSGAAEIGAIGHDKGLKTLICHEVIEDPNYDLIVINSGTRSLPESKAIKKFYLIANRLKHCKGIEIIFKKVDSVLRGHIVPEINVLHLVLGYGRVYLLPANPSKNRRIIGGKYFINNQMLHETSLAQDPAFPIPFSEIIFMSKFEKSLLKHHHVNADSEIPGSGLITGDIIEKKDFHRFVKQVNSSTLCCGAADFFGEILVNQHMEAEPTVTGHSTKRTYQMVINGSALRDKKASHQFIKSDTPILSIPGKMKDNKFELEDLEFGKWQQKVLSTLIHHKKVMIDIKHPVIKHREVSVSLLRHLADLVLFILEKISKEQIHFWIHKA